MAARFEIVAVGGLHRDLEPAARHYVDLLRAAGTLTVREVKEVPLRGRSPAEVLRDEGRRLLANWPRLPLVAALAVEGRAFSTDQFSTWLEAGIMRGGVGFVIGGSLGLSDEVLARADVRISLSQLTLPHQLARVVLLEQLFRAGKIIRSEVYHH